MKRDKRGNGDGSDATSGGGALGTPGKRTRTQSRPPSAAPSGGEPMGATATPATATPASATAQAPAEDPFGLHLLSASAAPGAPEDNEDGDAAPLAANAPAAVPYGAELEAMFGESFAGVTATTGDHELSARGIRAAAEGESVRFADDAPARHHVAHELTHVVQQRHADVSTTALLADARQGDDNAAEVEARTVAAQVEAGDLRPVTVSAAPAAPVQFERDDKQRDPDAYEGTASAYVDHNWRPIVHAIRAQIAAAEWTFPHPRLAWVADMETVAAAITSRLVELAETPSGAAFRTKHLPPFWRPVDLWNVVDNERRITQGQPAVYVDDQPTARGPVRRDDNVNERVAMEFVATLRAAFGRMVPRVVAYADGRGPSPLVAGEIVTSMPIDRLWTRVLADPALVHYVALTGSSGEAPTPTGKGVFAEGLRLVAYEWMGKEDMKLWNVLRVTSPPDATTEEVAATLYQYEGVDAVQSHNAYAITNAAPFFILPRKWAAQIPAAVKWSSAEHAHMRDEPTDVLLSSTAFDRAALAQGADEDAHPLARKGKASRKDTERLVATLNRGGDQLDFLAESLGAWGIVPRLEAERAWIRERSMALWGETPEQVAKWAPAIEAQQRVLTEASGSIVEVINAAKAAGIQPGTPADRPYRRTLDAYVAVVSTSHLADLARERMATAHGERQLLALALVDSALDDASDAITDLREAEGGSFGPDSAAGKLTDQRKNLQQQKLRQRAWALDGRGMDPEIVEDLAINAGLLTVRSRARELATKASSLALQLGNIHNQSAISAFAAAFDSRFDTIPDKLTALAGECLGLAMEDPYPFVGGSSDDPAERAAARVREREGRRQTLVHAQATLASIPARHGLDRLQREALDALSDNQIATLAINVIVLIAASVATSGIAAYAGGAARSLSVVRLGMSARSATVAGGAVDVAVDSVLTAAVQTGVSGDTFDKALLENVLSNVAVRATLARFAPMMRAFDDEAAKLWESGGVGTKGAVTLAKGAAVTAELVTAGGVSYLTERLVRGERPPSDDVAAQWFIQGASMAIGRMISARTTQLQARLDHAGARLIWQHDHPKLLELVQVQASLAKEVETNGDSDQAMRLLVENRKLLESERAMLRELEADPAKRTAIGMSMQERAAFARENNAALADTAKQGMDVMPLRLAGVEEVVPGAMWSGTSEQIATAIHQASAVGLDVRVFDVGNRHKRWRVQLGEGERILEIQERPSPHRRSAPKEARALLHAKAARELQQIQVTQAPIAGRSRGSYFVTETDGARMRELFAELDGAEVVEFQAGLLLRHGSDEWYFEFNEHAHALQGAVKASAIGGGLGLPASNVATVELWAFRGVRTIQGRKFTEWADGERAHHDSVVNDPNDLMKKLLWAGHVGISMDGGKTIYGLTPHKPEHMSREKFEDALGKNEAFDGVVGDDTRIFDLAREMAEKHGWNTSPERSIILMDKPEQSAILAKVQEMSKMKPGEHGLGYEFPLREPENGKPFKESNGYSADCVANCAKFPEKVGVRIPEPTGRMGHYVPELKKWIEADAPIDERREVVP